MAFNPIHNSKLNYIAFGATDLTGSLAKDSYIAIEPSSDLTEEEKDAGGYNTSISIMGDNSATVTIQLQAQSPANAELAEIVREEKALGTKIIRNINITANGTLYLYDLIDCFIKSRPSETKSESLAGATNTWVFYCSELREKPVADQILDDDTKVRISGSVQATIEL